MTRDEALNPRKISIQQVISGIELLYGLSVSGTPQLMDGGVEGAAWLVNTDDGSWYAKAFGLHRDSIASVEEETQLYQFLNERGLNVPDVRASLSGKKVTELKTEKGSYPFILMKKEELTEELPSKVSEERVKRVAQAMAKLHVITKDYPKKNTYHTTEISKERLPKDAYAVFSQSPNAKDYSPSELENIHSVIDGINAFISDHDIPENLTKAVLHGDLAFGHAPFLPNGEVYMFDFGDRWFGPCTQELAVMIENLYRPEDISFARFEQLKAWLLESYIKENPLTDLDLSTIKLFVLIRNIMAVEYLSQIAIDLGEEVDKEGVRRRLKLAEYLLKKNVD